MAEFGEGTEGDLIPALGDGFGALGAGDGCATTAAGADPVAGVGASSGSAVVTVACAIVVSEWSTCVADAV